MGSKGGCVVERRVFNYSYEEQKLICMEVFIQQIDTINMVIFHPFIDNFILLVACIHEQCFMHFVYFIVDVYLRFYFLHIIECHLFAIVSSFPTSILFFSCTLFLNFHPPLTFFLSHPKMTFGNFFMRLFLSSSEKAIFSHLGIKGLYFINHLEHGSQWVPIPFPTCSPCFHYVSQHVPNITFFL